MKIKNYGEFQFLKSVDEYNKELIELYKELGVGIATNTLITSNLDMIRRCEELIVIISFLEGNLKER